MGGEAEKEDRQVGFLTAPPQLLIDLVPGAKALCRGGVVGAGPLRKAHAPPPRWPPPHLTGASCTSSPPQSRP